MIPEELMEKMQSLQSMMDNAQEKLKELRAEGRAGGDLVNVTINGAMETVSVKIDPIAVDPRDIQMLEELIAAAFTDAVTKMRTMLQGEFAQMAGGMGMPPLG
ncbi:MAG: hypothetical protein B0D92_03420 [Spirochaeta sp. LUC14_002_19_P3]|nr:MAG: hypothetical protein B0D92_03420 [Spirochaeta sp. LUC14_002_19_P3]